MVQKLFLMSFLAIITLGVSECDDGDGDGWTITDGDCNDSDATVHPGADELCDFKDNDCDGATDEENATGCINFFLDLDGDGYGQTDEHRCLCSADGFYSTNASGDCYDQSADVHPNQEEYFEDPYYDSDGEETWDYNCSGSETKKYSSYYCYETSGSCTSSHEGYCYMAYEPIGGPACGSEFPLLSGCNYVGVPDVCNKKNSTELCWYSSSRTVTMSCR